MDVFKNISDGERILFWNEECVSFLCKNINIFLSYYEVSILLKYYTPYPLLKLVRMWCNMAASENLCDRELQCFFLNELDMRALICKNNCMVISC